MGMNAGEFRERGESGWLERGSMAWNGAEKEGTAVNSSISLKLSLFSLPISQPSEPSGVRTPPLYSSLSVPFQWEETPGKARFCPTDPIASAAIVRSLELPPRLLNEARVSNILSPTTVLEGPYSSKNAFSSASFRSSDGWSKRDDNGTHFGSKRWGGFRKNCRDLGRGSLDLLPSVGGRGGEASSSGGGDGRVTISREKKRGGLFNLSNYTSSHFLGGIYERCKKVVQWRRSAEDMEEDREMAMAINTVWSHQ